MSLWGQRSLIYHLTKRDFKQRYIGSLLGFLWVLITPLVLLAIYTFVFNVVMNAKWGIGADDSPAGFALSLFVGLVLYGIFSDSVNAAPSLVLDNSGYVTNHVFPIEILPVVAVGSALLRSAAGMVILILGVLWVNGALSWTIILLVLPITAFVLFSLGMVWLLSAIGVFIRDTSHTVSLLVHMIFFLTPIVYPVSLVPQPFRAILYANPFTHLVEAARAAAIGGVMPDWLWLSVGMLLGLLVFHAGYVFFTKSKVVFPDII